MKIVADREIFQVEQYLAGLGELALLPGREISAADVADADALLIRTVTRVDANLVQGSKLKFIGSASSGADHVEREYLTGRGIHFSHAPGCNADAVGNYVLAALAWLARRFGADWRERSAGIIGAGNVGGRLAKLFTAMNMPVLIHDPLLPPSHSLAGFFAPLEDVLEQDVVTIHVPFSRNGPYPTHNMLDASGLARLKPNAILINTARGEVIDNGLLHDFLKTRQDLRVVLDVWEGEPAINAALASRASIATPHIAGYSLNGKRNATRIIASEMRKFFGLAERTVNTGMKKKLLPGPATSTAAGMLNHMILQAYPIEKDFLPAGVNNLAEVFDARRNGYRFRSEFSDLSFTAADFPPGIAAALAALGFNPIPGPAAL